MLDLVKRLMQKLIAGMDGSRSNLVAGLDVGTSKICMIIAEVQPGGRVDIIGESLQKSAGVQRGVIVDIDEAAAVIASVAERAQMVAGAKISGVYVGVSGEHINSMNSSGAAAISNPSRTIRQEDVDRAIFTSHNVVILPDREIIHSIAREFSVDRQNKVKSPVGMSGNLLEVDTHIVHGMASFLENLKRCVEQAGLSIEGYVLASHAVGQAVLSSEDKEMGVAIVDIGSGTTDIACYSGGSISYSAVLPIGGTHITQDLAVAFQCSLAEAERVKIDNGAVSPGALLGSPDFQFRRIGVSQLTSIPKALLVDVIEPRVTEILQMADDALPREEGKKKLPAGIVLTGGTSLTRGLLPVAESAFGLPCRLGRLVNAHGLGEVAATPSHTTAAGLAIYGAEQTSGNHRSGGKKNGGGWFDKWRDAFSSNEQ